MKGWDACCITYNHVGGGGSQVQVNDMSQPGLCFICLLAASHLEININWFTVPRPQRGKVQWGKIMSPGTAAVTHCPGSTSTIVTQCPPTFTVYYNNTTHNIVCHICPNCIDIPNPTERGTRPKRTRWLLCKTCASTILFHFADMLRNIYNLASYTISC